MNKKILYTSIGISLVVVIYIFMDKKSINNSNNIHTKFENKNSEKKSYQIPKIKFIEDNTKKEVTKEVNPKPQSSQIAQNNMEEEIETDTQTTSHNISPDELPPEYKDFVPVTTSKAGEYEISVITDEKVKRNPNTPPSVPFLVTGKINGENFTIALPAQQIGRTNAIAYKDKDGKVKIKEIPTNDLAQSGMLNMGDIENSESSSQEQNSASNTDEAPQNGSLIPPMAPQI